MSLILYVSRCIRVDDEDNCAMEQVVSKLSHIYNNPQRAHTKVPRAEKDIIVVQTSLPINDREAALSLISDTITNRVKCLTVKRQTQRLFSTSKKRTRLVEKYDSIRKQQRIVH